MRDSVSEVVSSGTSLETRMPIRICIINEFFYPDTSGGTGTVLTSLAETLQENYDQVSTDVITSSNLYRAEAESLPAYEDWKGIHIHRVSAPNAKGLKPLRRLLANTIFSAKVLFKLLRQKRYDAILVGTAPPTLALIAHIHKILTRTPYLYIVYDLDPDRAVLLQVLKPNSLVERILRRLQRQWLHAASQVVVLGRCMTEYLNRTYKVPLDRLKTIATGCNPNFIRPLSKDTQFRAKHGLNGFLVCYSGNFGRYHNFDTILEAAKRLHADHPEIQFVLVGNGVQKAHIAERIQKENISNVHLFPFVADEEYNDLLASADVSLVTLEPGMEGLCVPSKFYSILSSGRPTIALVSPKSEVALVVQEAKCGVQVGQGDVEGLMHAIVYLATNPEKAEQFGNNARKALLENYSNAHVASAYYKAIVATVNEKAAVRQFRKQESGS